MTVRRFDGVDDFITLAPGGVASYDGGPMTLAYIWRPLSVHAGSMIYAVDGASTLAWSSNPFSNGQVFFATSAGSLGGTTYSANEWYMHAWTKADLSSEVRRHQFVFSTQTWTHTASGVSFGDTPNIPFERIEIGKNRLGVEFLHGDVAIIGVWNSVLSDTALELLRHSSRWWVTAAPGALWTFDQSDVSQPVQDVIGAADQTSIGGTTVLQGQDPPGFRFEGAGDPSVPTKRNEEPLRRVSKNRYGRDLQGALRRSMVTGGTPTHANKDINGICRGAYGLERGSAYDSMLFTLNTAPAP